MSSIPELSVGKILTVHHHRIEKNVHYYGFEINSERDIKSVFQIDYYFTYEKSREILESLQYNINWVRDTFCSLK